MKEHITVGVSQEWDAVAAATEVIEKALKETKAPNFLLLFTTIHYIKDGQINKILSKIYNYVEPETPLIGGTIAGFMDSKGVYTRGIALLSFQSSEVAVAIGLGRNTKRNPKKAAETCARSIITQLQGSKYQKKYYFALASSAKVPRLPLFSKRKVIPNIPFSGTLLTIFDKISGYFQVGAGRDDIVMDEFSKRLPDYCGLGGASSDDLTLEENYQFYRKEVYSNSIVAVGFALNESLEVKTSFGLNPTGKILTVTNCSPSRYIINEFDNLPAVDRYLQVMHWSKEVLDERLYRKVFYFPLVEKKLSNIVPRMFGLVYGTSFVFPMHLKEKNSALEVYTSSGLDILKSIESLAGGKTHTFGLFVSCGTRLETLGRKVYKIKDSIEPQFTENFLLIYTAGEYAQRGKICECYYQSDNVMLFD